MSRNFTPQQADNLAADCVNLFVQLAFVSLLTSQFDSVFENDKERLSQATFTGLAILALLKIGTEVNKICQEASQDLEGIKEKITTYLDRAAPFVILITVCIGASGQAALEYGSEINRQPPYWFLAAFITGVISHGTTALLQTSDRMQNIFHTVLAAIQGVAIANLSCSFISQKLGLSGGVLAATGNTIFNFFQHWCWKKERTSRDYEAECSHQKNESLASTIVSQNSNSRCQSKQNTQTQLLLRQGVFKSYNTQQQGVEFSSDEEQDIGSFLENTFDQ